MTGTGDDRDRPDLIFVHVPKSAGLSLFVGLCELFGPAVINLYAVGQSNVEKAAGIVAKGRQRVYCGHFSFGLHEFLRRPSCYFTVLRDPVARTLSYYAYFGSRSAWIRELIQREGRGAAGLAREGLIPEFYGDLAPWLDGPDTLEAFLTCPAPDLDNGAVRRFSGVGIAEGRCPDGALERAKETLERCVSVVGLVERYGETLELLRRVFGIEGLRPLRVNVTPVEKPRPDAATLRRIRAMNRLDIELYAWAAARFERQQQAPRAICLPGGSRADLRHAPFLWKAHGGGQETVAKLHGLGGPEVADPRFVTPIVA